MESEQVTRKQRIDPKLTAAGWTVVRVDLSDIASGAAAIEEFGTALGPTDYVLSDGSELLGVVDASVAPTVTEVVRREVFDRAVSHLRSRYQRSTGGTDRG